MQCLPSKKYPQINSLKLAIKDPEQSKLFVEQDRLVCMDRAKLYLVFNLGLLVFSPAYLLSSVATFSMFAGYVIITMLVVAGALIASRFRLWFIELILPLAFLCRAVLRHVIMRQFTDLECVPRLYSFILNEVGPLMFVTELVLFRVSIVNFVVGGLLSPSLVTIFELKTKKLGEVESCKTSTKTTLVLGLLYVLSVLPLFLSLGITKINELRLFLVSATLSKQQQIVLEIFERQLEGVIILQKPIETEDKDSEAGKHVFGKVLYANNAFK